MPPRWANGEVRRLSTSTSFDFCVGARRSLNPSSFVSHSSQAGSHAPVGEVRRLSTSTSFDFVCVGRSSQGHIARERDTEHTPASPPTHVPFTQRSLSHVSDALSFGSTRHASRPEGRLRTVTQRESTGRLPIACVQCTPSSLEVRSLGCDARAVRRDTSSDSYSTFAGPAGRPGRRKFVLAT